MVRDRLKAGVWTVPAERMKASRPHRVPLSRRRLEILSGLKRDRSVFLFPGAKAGKSISNMAMLELVRGMAGKGYTIHGFRSTFSDWARERTAYPRDVVEMALAHLTGQERGRLSARRRVAEARLDHGGMVALLCIAGDERDECA